MIPAVDYSNAIYYTLSTIARTLAAALAVLVAFVVVRLGKVDEIITYGEGVLRGKLEHPEEALRSVLSRTWVIGKKFRQPSRVRGHSISAESKVCQRSSARISRV